jgi:hypothetical protein
MSNTILYWAVLLATFTATRLWVEGDVLSAILTSVVAAILLGLHIAENVRRSRLRGQK